MNDEERQRRLDRVRSAIHAELAVGLMVTLLTGFIWIAAPSCMCPMFAYYEPSLVERLVRVAPVVLPIVGFVWMVRLSRPRPEAGETSWRYRS